jgi:hypothetical protein
VVDPAREARGDEIWGQHDRSVEVLSVAVDANGLGWALDLDTAGPAKQFKGRQVRGGDP